uniref:Uncharacterized protein n=1 Tax=viral metagenome TaxID=1070528 RepID=A0A6M3XGB9_9ZZZZ
MGRYLCKYAVIEDRRALGKELRCSVSRGKNTCPLGKPGEFTEDCIALKPFVYGIIFSTTIEEHEKKFHNLEKDC